MKKYDHTKIEKKWQKRWEKDKLYETPDNAEGRENFYLLTEFSYPSGNLHVGHWYAFAVPDILARFKRMNGFNVLYPAGFDAFGLPAENAAIKRGADPSKWTYENIDRMREQLKSMGNTFDWSREVITSDPDYYRWTQWLFLRFFKRGLAYRKEAKVNWCPSCKTVLANEQVIDDRCERCDTEVVEKELEQWFLKITDYAERLLEDLEELDWPKEIKEAQRNWIGRNTGALLKFKIQNAKGKSTTQNSKFVEVFTTRPDTLFGATYLVLSPEHEAIANFKLQISNWDEVEKYIKECAGNRVKNSASVPRSSAFVPRQREKTGVELKGIRAINPATKEEIPIWVADYILGDVGTGAIMAVPAHDERDHAFAACHNLPIRQVVEPGFTQSAEPGKVKDDIEFDHRDAIIAIVKHWSEEKYLALKWKEVAWGTFVTGGIEEGQTAEEAARTEIREETGYRNVRLVDDFGILHGRFYHVPKQVNRHAHARTMVFALENGEQGDVDPKEKEKHEALWLSKEELARFLTPDSHIYAFRMLCGEITAHTIPGFLVNSEKFNGMESEKAKDAITKFVKGEKKVTYRLRDWLVSRQRYWGAPIPVAYGSDKKPHAVPDECLPWLLPEDVDSTPTGEAPLARSEELKKRTEKIFGKGWRPEADTMDTFVDSSWYFLRYLDPSNEKKFSAEEKQRKWMPVGLYSGGAEHTTMHLLYSRFFYKALFDLGLVTEKEPYIKRMNRGLVLGPDGQKMSKRWGNVIDPDEQVKRVGADTVKMYLAFMGPYNVTGSYPWDMGGIAGVRRFLEKVWRLQAKLVSNDNHNDNIKRLLHKTIKKAGEDIEALKFNTAISALMILANELDRLDNVSKGCYAIFIQLLAPFAPHITEEIWASLGQEESVHKAVWPSYDEAFLREETRTIVIQIDGKVRDSFNVSADASEDEVKTEALKRKVVKKWIGENEVKKMVYVNGRLVSIVTA